MSCFATLANELGARGVLETTTDTETWVRWLSGWSMCWVRWCYCPVSVKISPEFPAPSREQAVGIDCKSRTIFASASVAGTKATLPPSFSCVCQVEICYQQSDRLSFHSSAQLCLNLTLNFLPIIIPASGNFYLRQFLPPEATSIFSTQSPFGACSELIFLWGYDSSKRRIFNDLVKIFTKNHTKASINQVEK